MTSIMTSEMCNESSSEELCGAGRKFQLSWKAKYTTGSSTTRTNAVSFAQLVQNAVKLQMPLTRGFICSICSKTQITPALNNDPRTVKLHCSHSEIVTKIRLKPIT